MLISIIYHIYHYAILMQRFVCACFWEREGVGTGTKRVILRPYKTLIKISIRNGTPTRDLMNIVRVRVFGRGKTP